jgi:hypothetical protein
MGSVPQEEICGPVCGIVLATTGYDVEPHFIKKYSVVLSTVPFSSSSQFVPKEMRFILMPLRSFKV